MKSGMAIATNQPTADSLSLNERSVETTIHDMRNPRPEAVAVYELEVLICRIAEGETRGRAANLPLPESRGATVREVLQMVIQAARGMINECLARDSQIPWIEPAALAEENESRFVVPLVM
ncbi:MAG: hypothetical protein IT423_10960 [Pirellulaceae bacterium]|nr:hypothetical protein [Pirellulaceae bacterium]